MREKFVERLRCRALPGGAVSARRYVEPHKAHHAQDACGGFTRMNILMEARGAPRA